MSLTSSTTSYSLTLPSGWHRVRLISSKAKEQDIETLLRRQLKGLGEVPALRRQLRARLREQAGAALPMGGVELFFSLMPAGPFTIAASMLSCVLPPNPEGSTLDELANTLTARNPEFPCEMIDLPTGVALKYSYSQRQEPSLDAWPNRNATAERSTNTETSTFGVSFYLPIPRSSPTQLLGLFFSSPASVLRSPLTELFDAAARTLRWMD